MANSERLQITGNAALLAVIHTIYGAFISYLFYYIFDEFDDKWKARSAHYKIFDVVLEIMLIATLGYWAAQLTEYIPPIFPITKTHELSVDLWVSGSFFVIALFLFLDGLTHKLKYVQEMLFQKTFSALLPKYGSILHMNLSYTPSKEEDSA